MANQTENTPNLGSINKKLYLKEFGKKGRGVCCIDDIKKGEIIEICPTIKLTIEDSIPLQEKTLEKWLYVRSDDAFSVVLGFGMLYNHSFKPNAQYIWDKEETLVTIIALKDIIANTEIRFNYHGRPDDMAPIWFPYIED